ncbi:hypothetical protein NKV53_10550 [Legionella sp. 27cVA30]|uniref:OTU domain-containing protein n=1 Tax=Legionella sp. 27cVA30 TaxID=2905657 RepID=UPI00209E1A08|nr:OTU domain-containing protein [Legionella sp. 27cVA30]MCP0914763.1 hypothetical protein [Legionella sp. 27cVA30]
MATPQHIAGQGFFQPVKSSEQTAVRKEYVNVGGNGDCGLRAVMACVLDNFLSNKRFKMNAFNEFLSQHFIYFPQHKPSLAGLVTGSERLQQVIKQVGMPELLPAMAYTLRQMMVKEIMANPEKYRGAFVRIPDGAYVDADTSPVKMRQPSTYVDETGIAAIAQVLDIPVKVNVVADGKELPMKLRYNETSVNPEAIIQLDSQHKHYMPMVMEKQRFASVLHSARVIKPVEQEAEDLPMPEIMARIEAEDKRLLEEYDSMVHRLQAMVAAKELTKQDLLQIYVKSMPSSDYLRGRIQHVGTEHGHAHFFDAITQAHATNAAKPIVLPESNEQQIVNELIHALARAYTINHISKNVFSAQLENTQPSARI